MHCSRLRIAASLSVLMPLGTAAYCASVTQWKPLSVPAFMAAGTVPRTRGLMYQPVVLAMTSTVPLARFYIVLPGAALVRRRAGAELLEVVPGLRPAGGRVLGVRVAEQVRQAHQEGTARPGVLRYGVLELAGVCLAPGEQL